MSSKTTIYLIIFISVCLGSQNIWSYEIDVPSDSEQLRLFLLKGYTSAKSVIKDIRIEYQKSQVPVNLRPINPKLRERLNISTTTSLEDSMSFTHIEEYVQKNGKERWGFLYNGKSTSEEYVSDSSELVRTEDSPHFKIFDGKYILDYMILSDSFTDVGRANLEVSETGFFESTELSNEYSPIKFFGYNTVFMPDDVLSDPNVYIETTPEMIDGLLTYMVKAQIKISDYIFDVTYWLSPERSCLPLKMEFWQNGKFKNLIETQEFMKLEDGRWLIKSILQRNYVGDDAQEIVNWIYKIRKIELDPEIDEDVIFNTSPDNLPEGAEICDNRSEPRLRYINYPAPSLINKPLPDLNEIGINILQADLNENNVLICFFDMQQRPSRNIVIQLNKRAQELYEKDIIILIVQTSEIENNSLDEWINENDISFPVAINKNGEKVNRSTWGVKALPWLILTNKQHNVVSEGFSINELDEKLMEI
ncbi:MAG: redoxin domain-containing protein [Sedimentisphaerales bacterium]|nr:redoxin domain-containing protein [Sedimentisphaerales bacterium]